MNNSQNPNQFWRDREKEIGSKILFYTMAKIDHLRPPGNWVLFYGTAHALFFHYFKTSGYFASFFGNTQNGEGSCHKIDAEQIKRVEFVDEKVFLKFFTVKEGSIILTFKNDVLIKDKYKTDVCRLVPIMKVSLLKKLFPRF